MAIHHVLYYTDGYILKNLHLQPVTAPPIVVETANLRRRSEIAAWWIQLQRYLQMWICRHLEMDFARYFFCGSCITIV